MQNILVTGGSGFLGSALMHRLKKAGYASVRNFSLTKNHEFENDNIIGDLRNPEQVRKACEGVDTVFHTAALIDWGPRNRQRLYDINVQGNRNLIAACQQQGVARLVYTSSIDVVFDGTPITNGDESLPYPSQHLDDYGDTKALAEQDILRANTIAGVQTCSLRAAGIYGPGDRHRFPSVIKASKTGNMVYMGDGRARFNHIYVGNLVELHLRAALALRPGSPVSGQAYFTTDHTPSNFYDFFTPYLTALGMPIPRTRIPTSIAYGLALVTENLGKLGIGPRPPLLTRYVVLSTCQDFYFSGEKARRDLGYQPVISPEQAFQETLAWIKTLL